MHFDRDCLKTGNIPGSEKFLVVQAVLTKECWGCFEEKVQHSGKEPMIGRADVFGQTIGATFPRLTRIIQLLLIFSTNAGNSFRERIM